MCSMNVCLSVCLLNTAQNLRAALRFMWGSNWRAFKGIHWHIAFSTSSECCGPYSMHCSKGPATHTPSKYNRFPAKTHKARLLPRARSDFWWAACKYLHDCPHSGQNFKTMNGERHRETQPGSCIDKPFTVFHDKMTSKDLLNSYQKTELNASALKARNKSKCFIFFMHLTW